jgi:hypothetical protein
MKQPAVDPALCPLCGEPNACALAQPGAAKAECWCASRRFDPELIARVPPERAGRACICSRCQRAPVRPPEAEAG